jgi:hypothetical protein
MQDTREGSIENPEDLNIDLKNITFENVIEVNKSNVQDLKVHDLEIENVHNYLVSTSGFVHNGGGKL